MRKIDMKTKGSNKTFDEGFEQFIFEHCTMKNFRPSTEKHYREVIKYSFYKFYDKDTRLNELEQDNINDYVLWLKERDIRDSTVNIQLKAIKTVIKFFREKGWIDEDLIENIYVSPFADEWFCDLVKDMGMSIYL